ncbi:D-alanyl-D-alanine carboxypeptidase [Patescibacteria group bacterium]|nr:D-alanyl-D-alanine carboxypeptidase [Patescibacteria group bacterium]
MRTPAPFPVKKSDAVEPVVQAKSALLVDVPSGTVLYSKNPDARLPIASITKLMSALLIVENTKSDDVVTMPQLNNRPEESLMGAKAGDQFRLDDLLAGSLIVSGNDATTALARKVSGSDDKFVAAMNKKADELGMSETYFDNPTGYGKGENVSSARDLVTLSRAAMAQPRIRDLVAQKERTVTALNVPAPTPENPAPDKPNEYKLNTTDILLGGYLPIVGGKTGTSDAAGPSLVSELSSGNRQLIAIVLNSPNRFQENKSMLDWALNSYRW